MHLTQALADAATIGILQERAVKHGTDLAGQLQGALNSRIVIEQAKGIVAERRQVDMDEAFALLRSYARSNRTQLSDVARAIIDHSLAPAELHLIIAGTARAVKRSPELRRPIRPEVLGDCRVTLLSREACPDDPAARGREWCDEARRGERVIAGLKLMQAHA